MLIDSIGRILPPPSAAFFFFSAVLLAILAMNDIMTPLSINKVSKMLVLSLFAAEYEICHISGKETFFVPFLPDTVWYVTLS